MFNEFIQKIKNKEPFSFIRIGDGEATAMFQTRSETHGNADGHLFFKDMGEAIKNVLISKPKYYVGMQRFAQEDTHPEEIKNFLLENNLQDFPFINADIWHHASIKGYFEEFFKTIIEITLKDDAIPHVILVGPEYLKEAVNFFPFIHLQIPGQNCWLSKDDIIKRVKLRLERQNWLHDNVVVLFCASMPAKIMIDELYQEFGQQHSFIDLGSVLDPYVGKSSRSYHKKIIERLNERNG